MEIVFDKTKKVLLTLVLTLLFISVTTTIFAAEPFRLNATAVVMYQGRRFELAANKSNVKYESSNERVATVDSNGRIEAKRMGIVTITATAPNGETASCKVRVKMKTTLIDRIRGAGLNISSATIYEGQNMVIWNQLTYSNCEIKEWKSSNENIVFIGSGGQYYARVAAKEPGTAKITATTSKGKQISVNIVVKELETEATQPATKKLDSIKITKEPNKKTYTEGENFDKAGMTVQAIYNDGTKQNITNYTVTDGNKLPAGKTTVTISYTEGGTTKTTTQTIKVNKKAAVETLKITGNTTQIGIGETVSLKANKSGGTWTIENNIIENGTDKGEAILVKRTDVDTGYEVKYVAQNLGTATIKVKKGSETATYTVKVTTETYTNTDFQEAYNYYKNRKFVINGKEVMCSNPKVSFSKLTSNYTIAIGNKKLNAVLKTIVEEDISSAGTGQCDDYAVYEMGLLAGKISEGSATDDYDTVMDKAGELAKNDTNRKQGISQTNMLKYIKQWIDQGRPVLLYVTSNASQHYVTVVGYKQNECNSFDDLLVLGPQYGALHTIGDFYETQGGVRTPTLIKTIN